MRLGVKGLILISVCHKKNIIKISERNEFYVAWWKTE